MYIEPEWHWDPVNGNDSNSGHTAGEALKTLAQLVERWGTNKPLIASGQTVTVHVHPGLVVRPDRSDDPLIIEPMCLGDGIFRITGVPTVLTTGTLVNVVHRNEAMDQKWQAQIHPINAAPYVGKWIHDMTVDAWFQVEADLGSGVAALSEPMQEGWQAFQAGNIAPAQKVIANGDSFSILDFPAIDMPLLIGNDPDILNFAAGGPLRGVFVDKIRNVAPTNYEEAVFGCGSQTQGPFLAECDLTGRYPFAAQGGMWLINCHSANPEVLSGQCTIIGGIVESVGALNQVILDGHVLCKGVEFWAVTQGLIMIGQARLEASAPGASFAVPSPQGVGDGGGLVAVVVAPSYYPSAVLWGNCSVQVRTGGKIQYAGTAVGAFVNTGGLKMSAGVTTAMAVDTNAGVLFGGRVLSPTQLDQTILLGGFGGYAQGRFGETIAAIV